MNDFYVYVYYDPRQTPARPFYVGKGTKDRYKKHLTETYDNTENKKKYAVIQAILRAGMEPIIEFHATGLTEDDAYEQEASLIRTYGRRDIDEGGILTNICVDNRPPNITGIIRPKGRDNPNYGKKMKLSAEEIQRRTNQIVEQAKTQTGENNPFYGKTHTDDVKALISKLKTGNKNNLGRYPDHTTRTKIQLNNPNRKSIHTPYGEFASAEWFVGLHPIISANGLRSMLKNADKPINKRSVANNPIWTDDNIGKTPRELGWYFIETNDE